MLFKHFTFIMDSSMLSCYQNLPHDAYKLLAVPSPIGGILVIGANTIHYHSQVILIYGLHSYLLCFDWLVCGCL